MKVSPTRLFYRCTALRCLNHAAGSSSSHSEGDHIKDRVSDTFEREAEAMAKVACFPHRVLTRPTEPLSEKFISSTLFTANLLELIQLATSLNCVSFSAPKGKWSASVLLIKGNPDDDDYDVWVNPEVPGYDDRNSVAPMYGMWENCISCSTCNAWVVRPQRITCKGFDRYGNQKMEVLDGLRARCLMHELDHLKGQSIIEHALGPEFVVSTIALAQRDLWPPNFPSAEASITPPYHFFDYVQNSVIVPPGLEWWHVQNSQHFTDNRLSP